MKRIDNGTYGLCITCGQPIAPARLEALPYAVTCMICASRAESERH
jgi:RNA polymerase-binding transcription factor DksA